MTKEKTPKVAGHRFSPRPNQAHLINWRHWDNDAFKAAQKEDKPVLLSISAVWCHWCHVFDETTLSDPEVIKLLNRDFIPVRVDADKHPHIQSRYLAGGWPTSAFLTPTGNTIVSGTYMHPKDFKELAEKVSKYYATRKGELYAKIARSKVEKSLDRERQPKPEGKLTEEIPIQVVGSIKGMFDPVHGGFGGEPKFPQPEVIELLLTEYYMRDDEELLDIAVKSLDSMMKSELWDKVEEGFFRYSTRSDWSQPHYEKMLEGNAGLLKDYLLGYQVTGKEDYRKTAEGIISYIDSHLSSPEGGFYGSQDADEEYYKLDAKARTKESPPKVDIHLYTNWNSLVISQYIRAYQALGQKASLDRALNALNFLTNKAYQAGAGVYHYIANGEVMVRGLLVDQVCMADALVSAYETTTDRKYLETAVDIVNCAINKLEDKRKGGFFDIPEDIALVGNLTFRERPLIENSQAVRVLGKLSYLTGREDFRKLSSLALKAFLNIYPDYSIQAATYALAVREHINHPTQITIIGPKKDPRTVALHKKGLEIFLPWKVIQVLDPEKDPLEIGPVTYQPAEEPVAYVCREGVCSAPLRSTKELNDFIKEK
ncbi:MAG: thioredoxin domain-containing protein [Candidatus Brocadiales bacterium]